MHYSLFWIRYVLLKFPQAIGYLVKPTYVTLYALFQNPTLAKKNRIQSQTVVVGVFTTVGTPENVGTSVKNGGSLLVEDKGMGEFAIFVTTGNALLTLSSVCVIWIKPISF